MKRPIILLIEAKIMINKAKEHLAEARSIHFAMRMGVLPYNEAKRLTKPLLEQVNTAARVIANRHNVKSRKITFQDLGRNL